VRYVPADEAIAINETQFFRPVPLEVWNFHIGGYQVLVITHPACADHAPAGATVGVARASRMAVRALRPLRRPVSTMEQRAA